jgi:hypothetical protein
VEKLKPSSDPAYWAKKGCKDCNGRGVIGTQTTTLKGNNKITNSLLCVCTRKRYKVWVEKTAAEVKAKLSSNSEEKIQNETVPSNGNGKKEDGEKALRIRLESLEDAISSARVEITREDKEINSYPHHKILEEIGTRQKVANEDYQKAVGQIEGLDKKATDLLERSQRLLTAAKSLARDADIVRQEKDALSRTTVSECRVTLETIQAEYRGVEKDLNEKTHKAKRRRRIILDKLDKFLDRRCKVIREAGFDPTTFVESIALETDESTSDS